MLEAFFFTKKLKFLKPNLNGTCYYKDKKGFIMSQQSTFDSKEEFIMVADEQNRNYWAATLGVSIETLKSAIRACKSTTVKSVRNYLDSSSKIAIQA